jgi:hypothetical protein
VRAKVEGSMLGYKIWVLCVLSLFGAGLFFPVVGAQEGLEESTTYQISLNPEGLAVWVVERRFILSNEEEVGIFQSYMLEFEDQKQSYLEEFANETQVLGSR